MELTFNEGDRVRVLSDLWENGWESGYDSEVAGSLAVVETGPDCDGDYYVNSVKLDSDGEPLMGGYVGKSHLEAVDTPQPTTIGTATVNVEVRFLIAGVDVTDTIKTLFTN